MRAFHRALRRAGGSSVIVAGPDKLAPVAAEVSRAFRVPASETDGYADEILTVAVAEDVALVVPTSPEGIRPLAEAASRFSKAGIRVAVSPADTVAICRDQYQVGRSLARLWVPTIETYLPQQLPHSQAFPLVVRPRYGSSDGSVFVARDTADLAFFLNYVGEPVVQPFVDGPEFAVDVVCGADGSALSITPRDRFS
ncbi:MAG TPA: ATP-grasp domain-containing protein, partial [Vicinamibacterales bacterium]|nr:ATP-grasp domain-containing protein [Vicinamibacterales bacterium]